MFWNKLKYKNIMQSGRSMVEIIGVLAVAGVLSIGAVSGYKYGMNKYRASQTINELKIRAVGLMQQVNRGEIVELNMEMGDNTGLGYTIDAWIKETDPKYFYISLENVPSEICKQILQEEWELATAIYVGHNEFHGFNENLCGNDTYAPPMDFEFYADFAEGGEYIEETGTFEPENTARPQQSCSDSDNPLGDLNGKCHACDTSSSVHVGPTGKCSEICPNRIKTGDHCYLKCSSDKPLMGYYGNCYACDSTSSIYVEEDGQCSEICPNRIKSPDGRYCVLPCTADKPLMHASGGCSACSSTSSLYVGQDGQCSEICSNRIKSQDGYYCVLACAADKPLVSTSGSCYACNSTSSVYVGPNGQCSEICPDRIKDANGYCVLNCGEGAYADKPLRGRDGNCYACNDTTDINVGTNGKCNEICANRQLTRSEYCSVSQTCDETKPLQDNYGKCYACNATDPVYVTTHGKCEAVCSNRVMTSNGSCALPCSADKPLMSTSGKCYACSDTSNISGNGGQCSEICPNRIKISSGCYLKKCPSNKPLQQYDTCYACNYTSSIFVGQDGACSEVCSNRVKASNGSCALQCSSDKPLMANNGTCYACNDTSRIYVGQDGQCSEVCSGRVKTSDGYCELPCPADKPLMNSNGTCYACDTTENVWQYSNQQCSEICSNRQIYNGYCIHSCGVGVYKTRPLTHVNGICYTCDVQEPVLVKDGECEEVCANRTKRDGLCYLNEEE